MWNDETGKAPDDAQGCEVMWVGTGRGEGQPAAARGAGKCRGEGEPGNFKDGVYFYNEQAEETETQGYSCVRHCSVHVHNSKLVF